MLLRPHWAVRLPPYSGRYIYSSDRDAPFSHFLLPSLSVSAESFPTGRRQGELRCPPVLHRAAGASPATRIRQRFARPPFPPFSLCCAKLITQTPSVRYLYSDLTMISPPKFDSSCNDCWGVHVHTHVQYWVRPVEVVDLLE